MFSFEIGREFCDTSRPIDSSESLRIVISILIEPYYTNVGKKLTTFLLLKEDYMQNEKIKNYFKLAANTVPSLH